MLRAAIAARGASGGAWRAVLAAQQAPWLRCVQESSCAAFLSPAENQQPASSGAWGTPGWGPRGFHSSPHLQDAQQDVAAGVVGAVEVSDAVEATPVGAGLVEFTPDQSAVGGALIGLAAASKLGFTGRILGVSGILGGLIRGDTSSWRLAWLGGLASGALALTLIHPAAFPVLPDSYSMLRAVSAGLLVGLGTSLGSGCTSGHGICGISRLAPRSMAATATFMASGAAVAAATGTMAATGADVSTAASLALMGTEQWRMAGALAAGSLAMLGVLRLLPSLGVPKPLVAQLSEAATGAIFALGLGMSGMLQPAKVAGFLSPLLPAWDPSLSFVMGAALAISAPAFQLIKHRAPLCLATFALPTATHIDKPLLVGALMFGAGWGLGGVCPGPGLVSLAHPTPQIGVLMLSMMAGMWLHPRLAPLYQRLLGDSISSVKKAEAMPEPAAPGAPRH